MSYIVNGLLFNRRYDAMIELVHSYVSAGGTNHIDDIKSFLRDEWALAEEMCVNGWTIIRGNEDVGADELHDFIVCNKASIIMGREIV